MSSRSIWTMTWAERVLACARANKKTENSAAQIREFLPKRNVDGDVKGDVNVHFREGDSARKSARGGSSAPSAEIKPTPASTLRLARPPARASLGAVPFVEGDNN